MVDPTAIRVERTVREVAGAPRPCLTAVDHRACGRAARDRVPGRAGRARRSGATPASPAGAGTRCGAPVRIAVRIDGEEAGAVELAGPGFAPFEIDTSHLAGRFHTVTLVLTSPGAPGTLCLDAVTLP